MSEAAFKRWIWIVLGLFALLLRIPFGIWPGLTERVYARGIFVAVRYFQDYTIGLLPFPLMYFFWAVLLGLVVLLVIRRIKRGRGAGTRKERFLRGIHLFFAWISGLIFFFLMFWGYNYQRIPVEDHLGLNPKPLQEAEIRKAAHRANEWLTESRAAISSDTSALPDSIFPDDLGRVMREELSQTLSGLGYPTPGRVQVKRLWPDGALMRFGVAGIYLPFTGQGTIPANMPLVDRPFTMAHELSHAMGFGDEGTCNFLAFLACEQSENPVIVYSGRLNYWLYISRDLYRLEPEAYEDLKAALPVGVHADLRVMSEYSRKYRSFMTLIGYRVNNTYLKTQGVREGIESYDRLVVLMEAWLEAT